MIENPQKSTSEHLAVILPQLSHDQLRYVVARQEYPTKKEAAEAIGLEPNTVYKWNGVVEEAAKLIALEALDAARAIRRRNLIKAIMVKMAGLDSADEATRQRVATEIIEWEMGKATNKTELFGKDGGPVRVSTVEVIKDYGLPDGDEDA